MWDEHSFKRGYLVWEADSFLSFLFCSGTVQPFNGAAYANGGGGGGGSGGQQQWGANRDNNGDWGNRGGDWHHHP